MVHSSRDSPQGFVVQIRGSSLHDVHPNMGTEPKRLRGGGGGGSKHAIIQVYQILVSHSHPLESQVCSTSKWVHHKGRPHCAAQG